MSFEEWWKENGDKALDTEEVRFQKYWYEEAYKAGYQKRCKDEFEGF